MRRNLALAQNINVRIDRLMEKSKVKAYASVTIGEAFAIHGIRVVEGEKGLFVSMPQSSYQNKKGETKYDDYAHPITADARTALMDAVIDAYYQEIGQEPEEYQETGEMEMSM